MKKILLTTLFVFLQTVFFHRRTIIQTVLVLMCIMKMDILTK